MRKYGVNKKNPNPPWPNNENIIVVPPGSGAAAIGLPESVKTVATAPYNETSRTENNMNAVNQWENRTEPIMGNMNNNRINNDIMRNQRNVCGNTNVGHFLCTQIGKYVKLEFLFGENTHMEKTGRLRTVGKDFVAIQENGTNNTIVCSLNKIKFINIYEYGI